MWSKAGIIRYQMVTSTAKETAYALCMRSDFIVTLSIWYHYVALGPQSMSQRKKPSLDLEISCSEQFVISLWHILISYLTTQLVKISKSTLIFWQHCRTVIIHSPHLLSSLGVILCVCLQ